MRRLAPIALLLVAAVALIAADCKRDGTGGPTPSSGIQGTVTIGPMCPVVQAGTPCPDQPYEATIEISNEGGKKVTTISSGADGTFRVALAPGAYTLHPQSPATGSLPFAHDETVYVADGAYTSVSIQFDSGIR
jgi:hypothetical protein